MKRACQFILFIFFFVPVQAQQATYNLNKTNGLPTNHIYCALVDGNGYLWLGTENGVVRYNGYETVRYGYDDGLPNIDVWNLLDIKNGKILALSRARGSGYFKNNKYHPFYIKNLDVDSCAIYPSQVVTSKDTTFFWNVFGKNWFGGSFGYVVGDTIIFHDVDSIRIVNTNIVASPQYGFISFDSVIRGHRISPTKIYPPVILCDKITPTIDESENIAELSFGHYIIRYLLQTKSIQIINTKNCTVYDVHISKGGKQEIQYLYTLENEIYMFSQDSIYIYNVPFMHMLSHPISQFNSTKGIGGRSVSYFLADSIWNRVLCTYNQGAFFNLQSNKSYFKKVDIDLRQLKSIGSYNDSLSLWWDQNTKEIITIINNKITRKKKLKDLGDVVDCKPYNKDTFIISGNTEIILFSALTNTTYELYANTKYGILHNYSDGFQMSNDHTLQNFIDIKVKTALINPNEIYFTSVMYNGLHYIPNIYADTIHIYKIDDRRCKNILFIKKANSILAYGQDIILLYNTATKSKKVIPYTYLRDNGVKQIEKIFIDSYDNVYIQDYNDLYLLDVNNYSIKLLFDHYNLENSIIDVHGDILTLAGSFGVAQYQLFAKEEPKALHTFLNSKGLFYSDVLTMQVSSKSILLVTDKGYYSIDLKYSKNTLNEAATRLICIYKDSVFRCKNQDTIRIDLTNKSLKFDVINPNGVGELRFKFRYDDNAQWISSSDNEISFLTLKAGEYHSIEIQAYDDVWNSEIIRLNIYIEPYWWQTNTARSAIGISALLLITIVAIITIVITRRIVSKNNDKKNQQKDLELKSIYSQINPHFIFNTLSTALYFVKRNENKNAYEHISQFSELLRAYLKASRNKYITITEEVENLENYLQLQLSRFEGKFLYNIKIDDRIPADSVLIPSLILQPVVENALNHGLFHKSELGNLLIEFKQGETRDDIVCIVDDDGIGRKKSKELRTDLSKKADSYGTILIKELVDTFNKYEPVHIEVTYIDKQLPNTGTTVIITIKNKINGNRNNSNNS